MYVHATHEELAQTTSDCKSNDDCDFGPVMSCFCNRCVRALSLVYRVRVHCKADAQSQRDLLDLEGPTHLERSS